MKHLVYVCDIDQDIDDMIACEYLLRRRLNPIIVLDRPSTSKRIDELKEMGAVFADSIPEGTEVVFCGGAFTTVAEYIEHNKLSLLVANGGFAGEGVVEPEDILPKFKGRKYAPTYNLNSDVNAALKVFNSNNVHEIKLISKNVCHSIRNTSGDVHWNKKNKTNDLSKHIHYDTFLQKYNLKPNKRLHDLLMVKEGLAHILGGGYKSICEYKAVDIHYKESKDSRFMQWGCSLNPESNLLISVRLREDYD